MTSEAIIPNSTSLMVLKAGASHAQGHTRRWTSTERALSVSHRGGTAEVPHVVPELSFSSTRILSLLKARHGPSERPEVRRAAPPHAGGWRQRGSTPGGDSDRQSRSEHTAGYGGHPDPLRGH